MTNAYFAYLHFSEAKTGASCFESVELLFSQHINRVVYYIFAEDYESFEVGLGTFTKSIYWKDCYTSPVKCYSESCFTVDDEIVYKIHVSLLSPNVVKENA